MNDTLKTALVSLRANKIRSFLTMLGVIIGVFAVVTLVSIGVGIQNFVTAQFSALGTNLVFVAPGKVDFSSDPAFSASKNKLSEKHLELIENYAGDYVAAVTPSIRIGRNIEHKTNKFFGTVIGANYQSSNIINYEVEEGRKLTRTDERSNARVIVLGSLVKSELFGSENALGKEVRVSGESFEVIGVLKNKGRTYDDAVIAPYTTIMEIFDLDTFSSIGAKVKDKDQVDVAIRSIEMALLRDLDEDDFTVLSQADVLASIQNILGILTAGIGAIAGISLLVGGIGIMNIMLVSVTERTKEIGLRKAVGAPPEKIAIQFLLEAVLLSIGGGMIGLLLGYIATLIAQNFIEAAVPIGAVALAFGFSVAVGVVFGTYPAVKASRKDPIKALTYE